MCNGIVATVKELIQRLFNVLEAGDQVPWSDTTDPAWYRTVCSTLIGVASQKRQPLWVAVDDLGLAPDGGPLLDTKIRDFCDLFAPQHGGPRVPAMVPPDADSLP